MSKQQYLFCINYFNQHPKAKACLLGLTSLLPWLIFLSYFIFLFKIIHSTYLVPAILLPMLALMTNTLIRRHFNAPRPLEIYAFTPLKPHNNGNSFPSRHSTSALIIALTITKIYLIWGASLILIAITIGLTRILCGVHFPKDVLGGFAISIFFGLILLWI